MEARLPFSPAELKITPSLRKIRKSFLRLGELHPLRILNQNGRVSLSRDSHRFYAPVSGEICRKPKQHRKLVYLAQMNARLPEF